MVGFAAFGSTQFRSFIHETNASNTFGFNSVLDHPDLNGDPNRRFIVQPVFNPNGSFTGPFNPNHVGLFYSTSTGKWSIQNQDALEPIPLSSKFFVLLPDSGDVGLVHVLTAENTTGSITTIDHALLNGSPVGRLVATWVRNPGGGTGPELDAGFSVSYTLADGGRWQVRTADGSDLPLGGAFNVFGFATSARSTFDSAVISTGTIGAFGEDGESGVAREDGCSTPYSRIFITQAGTSLLTDVPLIAVYDHFQGKWSIQTTDGSASGEGALFSFYRINALFLDGFESGNTSGWSSGAPEPGQFQRAVSPDSKPSVKMRPPAQSQPSPS